MAIIAFQDIVHSSHIIQCLSIINHQVFNSFINYMEQEPQNTTLGFADQYCLHHVLGEGGQATVYVGSKQTELYAIKVYFPGPSKEQAFELQTEFLKKLQFPRLINYVQSRLRSVIRINNAPQQRRPIIVLELAQGLDLFEYVHKCGKLIPEVCRYYAKQMIQALKYLVSKNITHRDLKPENILLDKEFNMKISDFGLAKDSRGDFGNEQLRSRVGTEGYRPPQMELGKYTGLQADMFAIGVILFIMYKGSPPFNSTKSHDRIYRLISQSQYQKFWRIHQKEQNGGSYPYSFRRLMNSFFCSDPERRPTFESLENDEWLNGETFTHVQVVEYMRQRFESMSEVNLFKELRLKIVNQQSVKECSKMQQDENEMG